MSQTSSHVLPAPKPTSTPGPINANTLWPALLEAASGNRRLRLVLDEMSLISLTQDVVTLQVSDAMRSAAITLHRDLSSAISNLLDRTVTVILAEPQQQTTLEAPAPATTRAPVTDHPLVKQAMELFGAKVIRVQPRSDADQS